MDTEKIYKLADELTEQQVTNIVADWISNSETDKINTYNSLVRLGDTKQLACATVIHKTPISKEVLNDYRFAYEN